MVQHVLIKSNYGGQYYFWIRTTYVRLTMLHGKFSCPFCHLERISARHTLVLPAIHGRICLLSPPLTPREVNSGWPSWAPKRRKCRWVSRNYGLINLVVCKFVMLEIQLCFNRRVMWSRLYGGFVAKRVRDTQMHQFGALCGISSPQKLQHLIRQNGLVCILYRGYGLYVRSTMSKDIRKKSHI